MIAHVAGVPVEELLLLVLASGAGTGLLLARAWVASRLPLQPQSQETGARSGNVRPRAGRTLERRPRGRGRRSKA
jgi:hypothetical protein